MKSIVAAATLIAAIGAASSAAAQGLPKPNPQPATYVSAGYTYFDGGTGAKFGVATARAGVKAGYVGAEVEAGMGVDSSHLGGIKTSLEHSLSALLVGNLPVTENVQLLGRVGYGVTRFKASVPGFSASTNIESFNFGGGAVFSLTEKDHIRADYTRYDTEGSGGANGWSVAYVRKF